MSPKDRDAIGLPIRTFLYTVDQIGVLLALEPKVVLRTYLFFEGRSTGACPKDKMKSVNIAPQGEKPEWRVAERELVRWMRYKGFRYYETGWSR